MTTAQLPPELIDEELEFSSVEPSLADDEEIDLTSPPPPHTARAEAFADGDPNKRAWLMGMAILRAAERGAIKGGRRDAFDNVLRLSQYPRAVSDVVGRIATDEAVKLTTAATALRSHPEWQLLDAEIAPEFRSWRSEQASLAAAREAAENEAEKLREQIAERRRKLESDTSFLKMQSRLSELANTVSGLAQRIVR